jgi:hypothetical protein
MNTETKALDYIRAIRNKAKHDYAVDYWIHRTSGTPEPERGFYTTNGEALGYMAAQAVRMRIDSILSQHNIDSGIAQTEAQVVFAQAKKG